MLASKATKSFVAETCHQTSHCAGLELLINSPNPCLSRATEEHLHHHELCAAPQ